MTKTATPLTARLGLSHPIIQAPMAGTTTPALAAAVSNAGALGSLGVAAMHADAAREAIKQTRTLTQGAFNINLFCHKPAQADARRERAWIDYLAPSFAEFGAQPPAQLREIYASFMVDDDMLHMLLDERPAVVSFHFGLPDAKRIAANDPRCTFDVEDVGIYKPSGTYDVVMALSILHKLRDPSAALRRLVELHRLEEQVRAPGRRRPHGPPDVRAHRHFRMGLGGVPQVGVEPLVAALLRPGRGNLARRVAEHRAEAIVERHLLAEGLAHRVDPQLGQIGPDAEHVREVDDGDDRHGTLPRC